MEIGSLLVTLAIAIIVVGYIARPLIENRGYAITDSDRRWSSLQAERDRVLNVLQDLDMDHAMGKIPAGDYREQRSELLTKGAGILRELDLLAGGVSGAGSDTSIPDTASKELEAQIEAAVMERRGQGSAIESNFCPKCGNALERGDRFCPQCGTATRVGEGP